jgi:putative transposase
MKQYKDEFSVSLMCRMMQVSRSAFYDWLHRSESEREKQDTQLLEMIKLIFNKGRGAYGTRHIKAALKAQAIIASRRRIGRLMQEAGLVCKTQRKFKAVTYEPHDKPVAPNLLSREFKTVKPNQVYVGDITYISTQEGWLYLAVVIDLYSRRVVGWSMAEHMRTQLVNDALLMAIWQRKPDKGLLWHTDQGSQYASEAHRQLLEQHGIIQSMSRKGNCWDNAVAESFFHTLKTELVHHQTYLTREEAKASVFEYIVAFYNRERQHSTNGYLSPVDYELLLKAA